MCGPRKNTSIAVLVFMSAMPNLSTSDRFGICLESVLRVQICHAMGFSLPGGLLFGLLAMCRPHLVTYDTNVLVLSVLHGSPIPIAMCSLVHTSRRRGCMMCCVRIFRDWPTCVVLASGMWIFAIVVAGWRTIGMATSCSATHFIRIHCHTNTNSRSRNCTTRE